MLGMKSLTILAVLLSQLVHADTASDRQELFETWSQTQITMDLLASKINNKNCNVSEMRFLGCVKGVNTLLMTVVAETPGADPMILAQPELLRDIQRLQRKLVKSLTVTLTRNTGYSSVYTIKSEKSDDGAKSENFFNSYRRIKRVEASMKKSWAAIHAQPEKRPDFESILEWIDSKLPMDKKAAMIGFAYNSYISNGEDAYGHIEPRAAFQKEMNKTQEGFVGIGVSLGQIPGTKKLIVAGLFEGFPAHVAGLLPNDVFHAINGVPVSTIGPEKLADTIRGPVGTTVEITVVRNGVEMTFKVPRQNVVLKNVSTKVLSLKPGSIEKAGYLKLTTFHQRGVCSDVFSAIVDLQSQKNVTGLILDLRNNSGGLLDETQCIAGLFLGPDKLVLEARSLDPLLNFIRGGGGTQVLTRGPQLTSLPMVVLINGHSASASEVMSGTLQGNRRAVILGERSFGKGTVLNTANFDSDLAIDTAVTFTSAMFYLKSPVGEELHTNQTLGIQPDIEVFKIPNARKIDKFIMRERELVPLSQVSPETASPPTDPMVRAKIGDCMSKTGVALTRYSKIDPTFGSDYQLLMGLDALDCNRH